jgi:hypothetical protein
MAIYRLFNTSAININISEINYILIWYIEKGQRNMRNGYVVIEV